MPQPTRLAKLSAHAEHLLDLFIGLREKYALLDPMIFDNTTIQSHGSGSRARGFSMLRNVVSMSCVLDIAKITLDKDDRTPSVSRLVEAIEDQKLRDQLRETFAVRNAVPTTRYTPDVLAAIAAAERRDEEGRRREFDGLVDDLGKRWNALAASDRLASFGTIRDKYLAHAELHHDGGRYRPLDVTSLGLTWEHLKETILELESLVTLVTAVYRSAAFAFGDLDEQLSRTSSAFWAPPGA
jgi:hypothetical protein